MKRYFPLIIIALLFWACNPKYDKAPEIGVPPQAKIKVLNSIGENKIVFDVETDNGFVFLWDFGNGMTSNNKIDTAYFPFRGDYTVKIIVSGKGGTTVDSTIVTINTDDPELRNLPGIKELTNQGQGRTWVFADDNCENDGAFFYMTANYDWTEFWWDPVADGEERTPEISEDSIRFDIDGNYNYTHWHDGVAEHGTFTYDAQKQVLKLNGANLPYYEINKETGLLNDDAFSTATFEVKAVNDTLLFLWQDQTSPDYDYGWAWIFKPKGVNYNCGK